MIGISIVPRFSRVKGDLKAFRQHLSKLTGDLLTQEACLTARMAIKLTAPMAESGGQGDKKAAEIMGNRAIDKDVRAIFAPKHATLSAVFADGRAAAKSRFIAWKEKNLPQSSSTLLSKIHADSDVERAFERASRLYLGKQPRNKVVSSPAQMKSLHDEQKYRGRVVRFGRPSKEVKRYPHVTSEANIKRYVKLRQLQVGKMKAGWWDIIDKHGRNLVIFGRTVDSGSKGIPKWIYRHSGGGNLSRAKTIIGGNQRIRIRNDRGNAEGVGDERRTHAAVVSGRMMAISKRPYQTYANRLVRNWNNSQRPGA
jgi:hypothetical protein